MKHEFIYNGQPRLKLIAENGVEALILAEMAAAAGKGATVVLSQKDSNEFTLEVK